MLLEGEVLEVEPVALPDCPLVDPDPVENVSFEVDCWSLVEVLLLGLVLVEPLVCPEFDPMLLELVSVPVEELAVDPLMPPVVEDEELLGDAEVPEVPLVPEVEVSLWPLVVLPAVLPEMLPEVLGEALVLPAVLPAAPAMLPEAALASTFRLLFTDCTPATDFASSFACFLSSLLATVPSSVTLPLFTEICTPLNAGSWLNC